MRVWQQAGSGTRTYFLYDGTEPASSAAWERRMKMMLASVTENGGAVAIITVTL